MNLKNFGDKITLTNRVKILWIILITTIIDIITKQIIQQNTIRTSNGIIDITYATNKGTMWSLFSNVASANTVFIILSFLAISFLYYYLITEKKHHTPISLIAGGIIGNLIDRILYGHVIDWINFHFFPIFNIADSAIVSGVTILIFLLIKEEIREHKKK